MALRVSVSRVLKDALALPEGQSFERCLGQSVRRHGGDYQDYIGLISKVRETARTRKISAREAARTLVDQS